MRELLYPMYPNYVAPTHTGGCHIRD